MELFHAFTSAQVSSHAPGKVGLNSLVARHRGPQPSTEKTAGLQLLLSAPYVIQAPQSDLMISGLPNPLHEHSDTALGPWLCCFSYLTPEVPPKTVSIKQFVPCPIHLS